MPVSVIVKVFSKCADQEPSVVTTVQSSASTRVAGDPSVIIGSTASARPRTSLGPRPRPPTLGTSGGWCIAEPMPCPV